MSTEKEHKKKKSKEAVAEDASVPEPTHASNGVEKKKKSKKSKRESEQDVVAEVVEDASQEDKKKKKKDKKKENGVEKAEEAVEVPADSGDGEKKKKKSKKEKREHVDEEDAPENGVSNGHVDKKAKTEKKKSGGIQFDFYNESPAVAALSADEVAEMRKEMRVEVSGPVDRNPVRTFAEAGFSPFLTKLCSSFAAPTSIQRQCWPLVLSGHDLIGIAATGSGKTMAFGFPGMTHVLARGPILKGKPYMIVLAPTRELAMQTAELCDAASRECGGGLASVCVYGGVPKGPQIDALRKGVNIVVATPGRLLDLMQDGAVDLSAVSYAVLDEADRMLDLGFEKDIRAILAATPTTRQTVMFSATWPLEIQAIGLSFMRSPVRVCVGSLDLAANRDVKQVIEVLAPHEKEQRLLALLKTYHASRKNRVLVFVLYKKEAVRVEQVLQGRGFTVGALHGDLSQVQRTSAMAAFRDGTCPLLVATDVAARGLDVPEIDVVINYTFPLTIEDYVHRIGRTGRAGRTGCAHTLFTEYDKAHAGALGNILREAGVEIPASLMKFGMHTKKKVHKMYGDHFKSADDMPTAKATRITFGDDD